jgi:hypothetical protein
LVGSAALSAPTGVFSHVGAIDIGASTFEGAIPTGLNFITAWLGEIVFYHLHSPRPGLSRIIGPSGEIDR